MTDGDELVRRATGGFGEVLAVLGATGVRGARAVRRDGLVGASVPWAADNHWIDAALATAGADLHDAPHCLWSLEALPGRDELVDVPMPCMALDLGDGARTPPADRGPIATPPLTEVGRINDAAYGQQDRLAPLIAAIDDDRVHAYGAEVDGVWACVALVLRLGDDASIQYVATLDEFRRRGLAARVLTAALRDQQRAGCRTATLQASPDGLPLYERLGFRTVATLRASVAR